MEHRIYLVDAAESLNLFRCGSCPCVRPLFGVSFGLYSRHNYPRIGVFGNGRRLFVCLPGQVFVP